MNNIIKENEKLKYPDHFPPREFYRPYKNVLTEVIKEFARLMDGGEREIDKYIREHPELFYNILKSKSVGHSGGYWILDKQHLKPTVGIDRGLIPDFIIGSDNSDGFKWTMIELKSPTTNIFSNNSSKRPIFSKNTNLGIVQLLEYIDCGERLQAMYRDEYKLTNFRKPNGILIIGRENELIESQTRQRVKSAFNELNNNSLQIRTYDWLLRGLHTVDKIEDNSKYDIFK